VPQILREVAPEGAFVVVDGAGQMRLVSVGAIRRMYAQRLAERAERAAPKQAAHTQKKADPKTAAGSKAHTAVLKAAHTQQLAEKMPEASQRVWGKIYNPDPIALKESSNDANPLYGQAKDIFNHWSTLAASVNNVYDPAKDKSSSHNFGGVGKSSDWWAAKSGGKGQWWKHDHTGRGY